MLCGSSANENVFKAAMFAYRAKQRAKAGRGPTDFTRDELESCMVNQSPGCANDLSILSFRGGFHGRTMAALTCTHSKPVHKLDAPAFDWPTAGLSRAQVGARDAPRGPETRRGCRPTSPLSSTRSSITRLRMRPRRRGAWTAHAPYSRPRPAAPPRCPRRMSRAAGVCAWGRRGSPRADPSSASSSSRPSAVGRVREVTQRLR